MRIKHTRWCYFMNTHNTQAVYKMLEQALRLSSSHQNKQWTSYFYMSTKSVQSTAPPPFAPPQSFTYLPVGSLKHSQCVQLQLKMNKNFTNACQIIRNRPETTDGGRQSMIRRILAHINLVGGHFKQPWIVTWYAIRTRQLLNSKRAM
jgi:hypothetical protein